MRRTLPSQLFRPEQYEGFLGGITGTHQGGGTAELLKILASVPGCLEEFWSTIEPAFNAGIMQQAAKEVRTTASLVIKGAVQFHDHLKWLDEHGYSREDNRQIRYVVEAYFHTEPCQAVLAAVAYRWILGLSSSNLAVRVPRANTCASFRFSGGIVTVCEDEPLPCLNPIITRYGSPVHSFFRSLAIWPEYLQKAWVDLGSLRSGTIFPAMLSDIRQSIDDSSRRVPICKDNTALGMGLLNATKSIQQYLNTSCEIILYLATLRRMFIQSEVRTRNQRIKASLQDIPN